MKKIFFKSMLLLCALIVGSGVMWGQSTYQLVTNVSQLSDGDVILIASGTNDNTTPSSISAVGAANTASNRKAVSVSVSENKITTTVDNASETKSGINTINNNLTKPLEITLVASNSNWNLKEIISDGNVYLNGGSTKNKGNNNVLKADDSVITGTGQNQANGVWSIAINTTTYVATIKNQNNFAIKKNSSSDLFASYSSGQNSVYIYKKQAAKADPTITFNNGSVRVGQNLNLSTLFSSNSEGAVTYSITAGDSYASIDGSILTGVAEGSVTVKAEQAAAGNYNAGEKTATITVNAALTLNSIAITTAPTKTTYTEGETFDPTGMVVTATYSNASTDDVTASCTFSPSTSTALSTSNTVVTVSYTENTVEKTTTQAITVNPLPKHTVSFDAGNGTYTGGDKTETEYQGGVVMPTPTGIPTGWSFYGWAASKQTSETNEAPSVTAAGATYYPTANVTLYAVYSLVEVEEKTVTGSNLTGSATTATKLNASHPITYKISSSNSYSNPLRVYQNNTLTIAGGTMSKIVLSGSDSSNPISNLTLSSGGGSLSNGTWTGSSSSVVFRASAQARVSSIKVTYTSSSTVYTSFPAPKAELSYAATEYDAALGRSFTKPTLTNTNGVTVTYESEDEDVATVDEETGDVTIVGLGTTTITASFAGNASYRKNSASYTLNVNYGTIAQIKELTSTSTSVNFEALLQDAVVTYVNGNYAYLQDASAAVMVNFTSHGLTAGDKINGKVTGTVKASNAIDVFTAFVTSDATVTDDGDIPAAAVKTLAEIKTAGTAYDGKLVTVNGAKVTTALTDNANGDITDDDGTTTFKLVCPYTGINAAKDAEGNFTGFVSIYVSGVNTTYRLNIYEESQISLTKNAPTAQTLTFASNAVELDEETSAYSAFTGQAVSGAVGDVTYSIDSDDDGVVTSIDDESGAVVLSGNYGTATIKATAAVKEVTEAGVTTPYTETSKSYTVTVYPRYSVSFFINGVETILRETAHDAGVSVPTPAAKLGEYDFVGWNTSAIVTPTDDKPNTVTTLDATIYPENNTTKYYAVYGKMKAKDVTATFTAANITATPKQTGNNWKHTNTGINLYISDGQRYTSNTPYTFTVKANGEYFEIDTYGGKLNEITVTLSGSDYLINNVENGANLATDGTTQTITFSSNMSKVKAYSSTSSQIRATVIVVDATINVQGDYRTTMPDFSLTTSDNDFYGLYLPWEVAIPSGIEAYTGDLNNEETALTITKIQDGYIPAATAVIVKSPSSTGTFTFTASAESVAPIAVNDLRGVAVSTPVDDIEADNTGKTCLTLGSNGTSVGFRKPAGTSIAANKVYLLVTKPQNGAPSAIRIVEGENNATNIENLDVSEEAIKFIENGQLYIMRNGVVYDAVGRLIRK